MNLLEKLDREGDVIDELRHHLELVLEGFLGGPLDSAPVSRIAAADPGYDRIVDEFRPKLNDAFVAFLSALLYALKTSLTDVELIDHRAYDLSTAHECLKNVVNSLKSAVEVWLAGLPEEQSKLVALMERNAQDKTAPLTYEHALAMSCINQVLISSLAKCNQASLPQTKLGDAKYTYESSTTLTVFCDADRDDHDRYHQHKQEQQQQQQQHRHHHHHQHSWQSSKSDMQNLSKPPERRGGDVDTEEEVDRLKAFCAGAGGGVPFPEFGVDIVDCAWWSAAERGDSTKSAVDLADQDPASVPMTSTDWEDNWLLRRKTPPKVEAFNFEPVQMVIPKPKDPGSGITLGSLDVDALSEMSENNSVASLDFSTSESESDRPQVTGAVMKPLAQPPAASPATRPQGKVTIGESAITGGSRATRSLGTTVVTVNGTADRSIFIDAASKRPLNATERAFQTATPADSVTALSGPRRNNGCSAPTSRDELESSNNNNNNNSNNKTLLVGPRAKATFDGKVVMENIEDVNDVPRPHVYQTYAIAGKPPVAEVATATTERRTSPGRSSKALFARGRLECESSPLRTFDEAVAVTAGAVNNMTPATTNSLASEDDNDDVDDDELLDVHTSVSTEFSFRRSPEGRCSSSAAESPLRQLNASTAASPTRASAFVVGKLVSSFSSPLETAEAPSSAATAAVQVSDERKEEHALHLQDLRRSNRPSPNQQQQQRHQHHHHHHNHQQQQLEQPDHQHQYQQQHQQHLRQRNVSSHQHSHHNRSSVDSGDGGEGRCSHGSSINSNCSRGSGGSSQSCSGRGGGAGAGGGDGGAGGSQRAVDVVDALHQVIEQPGRPASLAPPLAPSSPSSSQKIAVSGVVVVEAPHSPDLVTENVDETSVAGAVSISSGRGSTASSTDSASSSVRSYDLTRSHRPISETSLDQDRSISAELASCNEEEDIDDDDNDDDEGNDNNNNNVNNNNNNADNNNNNNNNNNVRNNNSISSNNNDDDNNNRINSTKTGNSVQTATTSIVERRQQQLYQQQQQQYQKQQPQQQRQTPSTFLDSSDAAERRVRRHPPPTTTTTTTVTASPASSPLLDDAGGGRRRHRQATAAAARRSSLTTTATAAATTTTTTTSRTTDANDVTTPTATRAQPDNAARSLEETVPAAFITTTHAAGGATRATISIHDDNYSSGSGSGSSGRHSSSESKRNSINNGIGRRADIVRNVPPVAVSVQQEQQQQLEQQQQQQQQQLIEQQEQQTLVSRFTATERNSKDQHTLNESVSSPELDRDQDIYCVLPVSKVNNANNNRSSRRLNDDNNDDDNNNKTRRTNMMATMAPEAKATSSTTAAVAAVVDGDIEERVQRFQSTTLPNPKRRSAGGASDGNDNGITAGGGGGSGRPEIARASGVPVPAKRHHLLRMASSQRELDIFAPAPDDSPASAVSAAGSHGVETIPVPKNRRSFTQVFPPPRASLPSPLTASMTPTTRTTLTLEADLSPAGDVGSSAFESTGETLSLRDQLGLVPLKTSRGSFGVQIYPTPAPQPRPRRSAGGAERTVTSSSSPTSPSANATAATAATPDSTCASTTCGANAAAAAAAPGAATATTTSYKTAPATPVAVHGTNASQATSSDPPHGRGRGIDVSRSNSGRRRITTLGGLTPSSAVPFREESRVDITSMKREAVIESELEDKLPSVKCLASMFRDTAGGAVRPGDFQSSTLPTPGRRRRETAANTRRTITNDDLARRLSHFDSFT